MGVLIASALLGCNDMTIGLGLIRGTNSTPIAPALFLAGQSNAGNQDTTPGTVDARVSVFWTADGTTFTGPTQMALQSGGHSFEWQAGSDMAAYYGTNILTAKTWADGTLIDTWLPAQGDNWVRLARTLELFARQCVIANVTQVEFGWQQGESNCVNSFAGSVAAFQSNTNEAFDAVKYLLEGFGLTVHFSIFKLNASITTGVNPGDTDAGQLAAVRAAQVALAAARTDTTLIDLDSIVMIGSTKLHYLGGQTNIAGSIWASSVIARYTGAQPALNTPPTVAAILGSKLTYRRRSSDITGVADGGSVGSWPAYPSAATQTGSARPTLRANALGTLPEVEYDGVDDAMPLSGVTFAAPGTTPFLLMWVGRQKASSNGKRILASDANFFGLYMGPTPPQIAIYAGTTSGGFQANLTIGTFGKVEAFFNHSADYLQVIDTLQAASDTGNLTPGAMSEGSSSGGSFSNVGSIETIICNAALTKTERNKMRGYGLAAYGYAVWGVV